jgi:hypothetical protein
VEGLKALNLVVDIGVLRITLCALGVDIGNAIVHWRVWLQPAAGHQHTHDVMAQRSETIGALQSLEEHIAFVGHAVSDLIRVAENVI